MINDKCFVSIIIPCYNQAASLRETLETLCSQNLPQDQFEVVLIDDGSSDSVKDVVAGSRLTYKFTLQFQDHLGAAAARNKGASIAIGDVLLFLDADMIVDADLIIEHLKSLHETEHGLIVGRRIPWPPAQKTLFQKLIDIDSNVTYQLNKAGKISFSEAFTCNLSIRAADFWALSGFDVGIYRWEDIDFSYRAHLQGYTIQYNPAALAYHNHPMTFQSYCEKMRDHYQASVPLFIKFPQILNHPFYTYLENKRPISWGEDSFHLILTKMVYQILAFKPILAIMKMGVTLLEKLKIPPALMSFFYWRVLTCYELIGFREGVRRYGFVN